jgi:flagellar assembly protein FliH
MTSRRVQLDVFELSDLTDDRVEIGQTELEECRLAAFEQGYTAGWDDAVAAQDSETARLNSDLSQNLQDLSFTYHEAHNHVLSTLEPLLQDMVTKVMPAMARESLSQIVLEHLIPAAKEMAGAPIVIKSNAANKTLLERLLVEAAPFPLTFSEEPSLGNGQVYLSFGHKESRVDLDGAIAAIAAAVTGFFQATKDKETANE